MVSTTSASAAVAWWGNCENCSVVWVRVVGPATNLLGFAASLSQGADAAIAAVVGVSVR